MKPDMWIPSNEITIRDYFAAMALNGVMKSADEAYFKNNESDCPTLDEYAHDAYRIADAMLAERSKPMNPAKGQEV